MEQYSNIIFTSNIQPLDMDNIKMKFYLLGMLCIVHIFSYKKVKNLHLFYQVQGHNKVFIFSLKTAIQSISY